MSSAASRLDVATRTSRREDWTPVLDAELEALLEVERNARQVSRVLGPTPNLNVALRKLDKVRRG